VKGLVKAIEFLMKQKDENKTGPYSFEDLFYLLEEKIEEMDVDLSSL
jgi:hypothetical protein